jgi:hypothetical protein
MLFVATSTGVYRASDLPFDSAEHVIDGPTVRQLHGGDDGNMYACTDAGLFRTINGGETWTDLGVPDSDVYSVLVTDDRIYAGVEPAAIYCSVDAGETWTPLDGFSALAADSSWPTNPHHDSACVRSLAAPSGPSDLLLAGVEVGGLVVRPDRGGTWHDCPAVPDDVHHVLPVTGDRWVVSCGTGGPGGHGGVFETRDAGDSWTRLDTGEYAYVRESCYLDGLSTAANRTAPFWEPPDARMFHETGDRTLERVSYPGEPTSYVISWTTAGDALLAGTNDGQVLRNAQDDWERVGRVPVSDDEQRAFGVRSLAVGGQ